MASRVSNQFALPDDSDSSAALLAAVDVLGRDVAIRAKGSPPAVTIFTTRALTAREQQDVQAAVSGSMSGEARRDQENADARALLNEALASRDEARRLEIALELLGQLLP